MVTVYQTGVLITDNGVRFLESIPIRPVKLNRTDSVMGECQAGVLVMGAADKIDRGVEQRNDGIKKGAYGCTSIVIREGRMMVPPDWDLDANSPDFAKEIRDVTKMTNSDALIISGGADDRSAVSGALFAAFNLI